MFAEDAVLRFLRYVLLFLFLAAVLGVAFPDLAILAAITIIGLPLSFLLWVSPACFVILALLLFFYAKPESKQMRIALAAAATIVVLGVPPTLLNLSIESQVANLVKGDFSNIVGPIEVESIAVLTPREGWQDQPLTCDGFCLHALLGGEAKRFLVARTADPDDRLDLNTQATEFTLQRQETCPDILPQSGSVGLALPDADGEMHYDNSAIPLLNLRISEGECLVKRTAPLHEADLIISSGRIKSATGNDRNFDLLADTIEATRSVVFRMDRGATTPVAIDRRTTVTYRPFAPVLLPVPSGDLQTTWGWMRMKKTTGSAPIDRGHSWGRFLTHTLGFYLRLEGGDADSRTAGKLRAVLDAKREPTAAEWNAFEAYLDRAMGKGAITDDEHVLLMRIIASPLFPTPKAVPLMVLVRTLENAGRTEDLNALSAALIDRADRGMTWSYHLKLDTKQSLQRLDPAIAHLPVAALQPHFSDLERLSDDLLFMDHARRTLARLPLIDQKGTAALLRLMKKGMRRGPDFTSSEFERPYVAGLTGLCDAGAAAGSAAFNLLVWIGERRLPMEGKHGYLLATTLTRLGLAADSVRAAFSYHLKDDTEKKRLDLSIERGRSNNAC